MTRHRQLGTDARITAQFIEAIVVVALMVAIAVIVVALPSASWWH